MDGRRSGPVVVGVDGSDNARGALVEAVRLAGVTGARLVVVHAVGLTEAIDGEPVPAFGHRTEITERFERWCEAGGAGSGDRRLVDGAPIDVLLRVADEVDAGTIVVGRRGVGGRPELLVGSTAHQVMERARCPVLVVPPAAVPSGDGTP